MNTSAHHLCEWSFARGCKCLLLARKWSFTCAHSPTTRVAQFWPGCSPIVGHGPRFGDPCAKPQKRRKKESGLKLTHLAYCVNATVKFWTDLFKQVEWTLMLTGLSMNSQCLWSGSQSTLWLDWFWLSVLCEHSHQWSCKPYLWLRNPTYCSLFHKPWLRTQKPSNSILSPFQCEKK